MGRLSSDGTVELPELGKQKVWLRFEMGQRKQQGRDRESGALSWGHWGARKGG